MHPDLKTAIELQQVDLKIGQLTAQIDTLPSQILTLERQLEEFLHAHRNRQERLAANQKERRELEGEVQVIRQKIGKHKDQLYEVKTNEQYRAMLKEIEGEEGNIRKVEDQLLEKMIEAEEIQKAIAEAAARLESEKARVAGEKARLEGLRNADIEERGRLQKHRTELAQALSESTLRTYERVRAGRPVSPAGGRWRGRARPESPRRAHAVTEAVHPPPAPCRPRARDRRLVAAVHRRGDRGRPA